MNEGSRQGRRTALHMVMIFALLASVILAVAIDRTDAYAAPPAQPATASVTQQLVVTEVATLADVTATAAPGEGVIRIMTRACGSAPTQGAWQAAAAANGISAPTYLVLLGQRLTFSCSPPSPGSTGGAVQPPPSSTPRVADGWANPLPGYCLTPGSGFRTASRPSHNGVDIGAGNGNPAVHAAAAGTLSTGREAGGAGNYAMVNHGNGLWTVYMHFASFELRSGWVNAGQVLGYAGATGNAFGNHLHFEVHTGGLWAGRVNPSAFMAERGVRLGC